MKLNTVYNQPGDPETWVCSYTPRFSYEGPETCVRAVTDASVYRAREGVPGGVWYREGVLGGYTGWVIRGPASSKDVHLQSGAQTSGAGPGSPTGAGVGGSGCSAPYVRPWVPPLRPCRPPGPLRCTQALLEQMPPLGQYKRELTTFTVKLVKTVKCHQDMSKRPSLVPVLKTASRSHLLIFLDFRFLQPSLPRN